MAPRGVCEACLHQVYKPCASETIPSQTYMGMYDGGLLKLALWEKWDEARFSPSAILRRPPSYIPKGLWWNCSTGTRFVNLLETSFTDPRFGLNLPICHGAPGFMTLT